MSTSQLESQIVEAPFVEVPENYLNITHGIWSWLLTKDHKRIGIMYLVSVTVMFFIGGFAIAVDRLNLLTPEGSLIPADTYNRLFTLHGVIMVFFFLVPVVPAALGNFILPLMIGAKDLALPRINLLSWYLYVFGGVWTLYAMIAGGLDTGWTFYTPYSSQASHYDVVPTMIGVVIAGFSSLLTGLNFVVTTHWMRAPGLTWRRLPIFVWTLYATSIIFLLAVPVLAMDFLLVIVDRTTHMGIFDPKFGGDPLLFQHLFWFYSHPAVYIMILPGMGIVSEIIPCFAQAIVRIHVRAVFHPCHCGVWISCVGPPHVCGGHFRLFSAYFLRAEFFGRGPLGH